MLIYEHKARSEQTETNLSSAQSDDEVSNKCIFSFTTSVWHHHSPTFLLGHLTRLNGLSYAAYLVNLSRKCRVNIKELTLKLRRTISHGPKKLIQLKLIYLLLFLLAKLKFSLDYLFSHTLRRRQLQAFLSIPVCTRLGFVTNKSSLKEGKTTNVIKGCHTKSWDTRYL